MKHKKYTHHSITWPKLVIFTLLLVIEAYFCQAQTINAKYVHDLYKKYPTAKSNFCPACRIWVNPFYTSIADTVLNYPVVEHAIVTSADIIAQEAANIPRTGIYANWNTTVGAIKYDDVYSFANKQIGKPMSVFEIVYGHAVLCWILAAHSIDGVIFSNTETYGEFPEYQGQNIGTMINTEDSCRIRLGATIHNKKHVKITDRIDIWAGCVSSKTSKVYSVNGKSITVPGVVWKVVKFNNQTNCYWMPNLPTEVQALTVKRHISYSDLVKKLGFDPCLVLK